MCKFEEFLSHGLSWKWISNKAFFPVLILQLPFQEMLQANLYLCCFPWASLFCSGYDAYRILFTLRVFIWIDLISSLFVVVSWFAVFVRFFMVSVVETWWKNSGTGVFLCLDSCVCIAFVSLEEFICVRSCDWREMPNFDIWLRKIICTSHKFTAKNAKIPTRWSTVSWQWDSIKTHGPSPTSNYDCRCCTTRNCCQHIPVDKEEVWVAVDHAGGGMSISHAFVRCCSLLWFPIINFCEHMQFS